MDILSNFFNFLIFTFTTIASFHGVFLFRMIISLRISKKSKSLSTCKNWCFNPSLSTPPSNSIPFHALEKTKNALLMTTFGRFTKLAMSTLKWIKEGEASVLSTMSLIYNMLSIFKQIEQQG